MKELIIIAGLLGFLGAFAPNPLGMWYIEESGVILTILAVIQFNKVINEK